jgi:membrane protease YdiL (CAAX protease family)
MAVGDQHFAAERSSDVPELATRARRGYLAVEYAVLFFGLVSVYALFLRGTSPIPVLVVLAGAALAVLLRAPDFDRASLWRPGVIRGQVRSIAGCWALAVLISLALVLVLRPEMLLGFPRAEPVLWALVMVLYPILSVYPQELLFRAFLFHRYRPLFGDGVGVVLASAAAFGFAHIAFGNWIAVVLSLFGGALFALRYQRTRSLLCVSVEHALYGMLVFTIGLGDYFYHGSAG